MEGESLSTDGEIVIDIEPLVGDVKEEPSDEDGEGAELIDECDDYEDDSLDNDGEEDLQSDKEDLSDEEGLYDQTNHNKEKGSEFTIHAVPSTSKQSDNMIYFEIPAIASQCKCVVCGISFQGDNSKSDQYICNKCLKNKNYRRKQFKRNTQITTFSPENTESPVVKKQRKYIQAKPYECEECSRKCKSVSDLTKHKLIHSGERPFGCDTCPKRFNQLSNLVRHKLTHSEEKPFQCNVCMKTFTQLSYLKKHFLIHSGEKPYGCTVCLKYFNASSTLAKHKLIHTGEKPYCCNICSKTFNQLASLRRHEVIHSDEKLFECNICLKRFSRSDRLKRHQTIHRDKYESMF